MWNGISRFLPSWSVPKPTGPPVGNVTSNNTSTQPQDRDINDSATLGHGNLNDELQTPDNTQCDTPHDSDRHSTCSGCFKDEDAMASSTQTLVNLGFNNNNETRGAYTNEDRCGYSEPPRNYNHNTTQPQLGENQNTAPTARDSGLDGAGGPLLEEVNGSELQPLVGVDISDTNMHPKRVDLNGETIIFFLNPTFANMLWNQTEDMLSPLVIILYSKIISVLRQAIPNQT